MEYEPGLLDLTLPRKRTRLALIADLISKSIGEIVANGRAFCRAYRAMRYLSSPAVRFGDCCTDGDSFGVMLLMRLC